jgi:hypothetical protein
MIGATLSQRARRIRWVGVENITATLDEDETGFFPARLFPPADPSSKQDGSPRDAAARFRLVWNREAPDLPAASRVELFGETGTYELLTAPEALRRGQRVAGYQAEVLELSDLYPIEAEVEGVSAVATVPLSLYTGSEQVLGHGDYEDYEGQAPIEFWEWLEPDNTRLLIDDHRFSVTSSVLDVQIPHVKLRLRKVS